MLITHWLYYGMEPIASVRAEQGTDHDTIRGLALAQHLRVPLCYPTAPYEHSHKILSSRVRTFEEGR